MEKLGLRGALGLQLYEISLAHHFGRGAKIIPHKTVKKGDLRCNHLKMLSVE